MNPGTGIVGQALSPANSAWRTAAALAFMLALTVLSFRQLTLSAGYTWLENPDQALQVRPWFDYEAREFHAGRLPLWDPYEVCGQSLIAQVQPGLANPLNWLLFAMPLRDGHIPLAVLHWYWVLIRWLAAVFAFALCRDLKAGVGASLLGASVFAFGGFMGHSSTPQFLMSALYLPLVLLFFARVFRGQRPATNAALSGLALGLAFTSGHHNLPIYTAVLLAGLWLWLLVKRPPAWKHAAIFCAIAFLISAVQLLPAVEYGRRALRWSGAPEAQHWKDPVPYSVHAEYSLMGRSIPGLVIPGLSLHANPFVGIVALSLALTAVCRRWSSGRVRLLAAVSLGGLLLALGADSPVHRIAWLLIPMVEKARYPAMAIAITQIGIAALAALGLDAARRMKPSESTPAWLFAFAIAIFGLTAALRILHHPSTIPADIAAAVALALAAVLRAWRPVLPAAALVLFFVELTAVPLPIRAQNPPGSLLQMTAGHSDIAEFLHRQPGWFRVQRDEDAAQENFGDFYSIEEFNGYVASMPVNINQSLGRQEAPRWFGVQFYIGRKPLRPEQQEVFTSRSGLKVYRNPGIGEPLWAEHDDACRLPDRLTILDRTPGAMTIDADMACAGRIVAGDPWFPGWRAWIDGRRIPIQQYAGVIRALPVAAGRHRIQFRYRPGSVYWGAGLTVLGMLLVGVICRSEHPLQGAQRHISR